MIHASSLFKFIYDYVTSSLRSSFTSHFTNLGNVLHNAIQMVYTKEKTGGVTMATKSANVMARVEPDVKQEAETIIAELGLSVSTVINSLYKQIIIKKGIPYSLTLSSVPKAVDEMTKAEFDTMMKTGLAQARAGESISVDDAFDDLLRGV